MIRIFKTNHRNSYCIYYIPFLLTLFRVKTWICHQPDNWQTLGVLLLIIVQVLYNKFLYNQDGTREEGKYKNNILITSNKKKHLFLIRSAKFRERIDSAVNAAQRASKIALQKADIAISRWE